MKKRVVIAGMGQISPQGIADKDFSKVRTLKPDILTGEKNSRIGYCKVADYEVKEYLPKVSIRCTDSTTRYTGTSVGMALSGAINNDNIDVSKIGMVLGTTFGSVVSIVDFDLQAFKYGPNGVNPMEFPNAVSNAPSGKVGIWYKLKGPSVTISNGFTSSLDAVVYAFDEISDGNEPYFLAGGSEEISENVYKGYCSVVSNKADNTCEGAGKENEVIGEGAGMILLGCREEAIESRLNIYGEVLDCFSMRLADCKYSIQDVSDVISDIITKHLPDKESASIYLSRAIHNRRFTELSNSLHESFGSSNIVITNRLSENTYINYPGLNGVFNIMYAIDDIQNDNCNKDYALVLDMGCEGTLSCVLLKK